MGTENSIYTPCTLIIAPISVHAQRGLFRVSLLPHPLPVSDGNLHRAALLRMRGNYFRPYVSISARAIETQHNNENSYTISVRLKWDIFVRFLKKCGKLTSNFKQVRNSCDIAAISHAELSFS